MTEPMLFTDMCDAAESELAESGIENHAEVAKRIAGKFCELHRERIYRVPTLKAITKAERDIQIINDSKKMSVERISHKYGLTKSHIYVLIRGRKIDDQIDD